MIRRVSGLQGRRSAVLNAPSSRPFRDARRLAPSDDRARLPAPQSASATISKVRRTPTSAFQQMMAVSRRNSSSRARWSLRCFRNEKTHRGVRPARVKSCGAEACGRAAAALDRVNKRAPVIGRKSRRSSLLPNPLPNWHCCYLFAGCLSIGRSGPFQDTRPGLAPSGRSRRVGSCRYSRRGSHAGALPR